MEEKQGKGADAKSKKPPPAQPQGNRKEYPEDINEEEEPGETEEGLEPDIGTERERPEREEVIERTIFETEAPSDSGICTLLSVSYNGAKAKALLKLYDHEKGKTLFWYDNTNHKPYCLTDLPPKKVLANREITGHPGFDRRATQEISKRDLLHDRDVCMTKVVAKDPLSIGGQGRSLRDILPKSWEANIRYHDCYIYDQQLIPGYTYRIRKGKVEKVDSGAPMIEVRDVFKKSTPEFLKALESWLPLFVSPVPDYRRMALDIEVATEALDRIPDPSEARNQVICVSLAGSDGLKKVVVLKRPGVEEGEKPKELPDDVQVQYFDEELPLLNEVFRYMLDSPIVLTFNGDNFDLHYLWRRAQVLGMRKEEVPILMGREIALLPVGVHFDLYKFFHNHAIQIYAFGNAYREVSLDAIAAALLNKRKIPIEKTVSELSYGELIAYCFRDSEITLALTTHKSNLVMNLVTMIMRISRLSMEDVTRQGVSRWIRSLFFSEHRAQNCLIPLQEDIESMKGGASTTAIIKGKKYQGAMVIKPESKVYFDVVVMDFASLYPSIIARWNLSYETVNCVHPECMSNLVPHTTHWVCKRRVGMMGLIIGLLKDVRVKWFKQKSRDQSLSAEQRNWYKVVQQALKVFLNACFTEDTDVLTTEGARNIKDVRVGDTVINVNPATLEPEVDEVVDTQSFLYRGSLLHFENNRCVDLTVTPDHRFLLSTRGAKAALLRTAEEVFNSRDLIIPRLNAPLLSDVSYVSFLEWGKTKGWGMAIRLPASRARHVDSQHPELWALLKTIDGKYNKTAKTYFVPTIGDISGTFIDRIIELGGLPYLAKFGKDQVIGKQNRLPVKIELDTFASLCGWIISEGSLGQNTSKVYPNGHKRGLNLHIDITQSAGKGNENGDRYRQEIEGLLKGIGVKYSKGKKCFRISNELLYHWVDDNCYSHDLCEKCRKKHCSHRKKIPSLIMSANNAVLNSFLDSLYKGDGSAGQILYSTASEPLASQLPVILARLGFSSKRFLDEGGKIIRLTWRNTNQHTDHWAKEKVPFDGNVYCLTTKKNHTVFAGRNGKFAPVGQCYGVFGAEIFPLYCLALADSTTAIGRHIIQETIEKATKSEMKVVYGDTDSLFLHKPTAEQITNLLTWADSSFGIDLEVDKHYTFVTFSGRKKNYLGVMDNGLVDIKGLMGKKRNTPTFIKEAFTEMTQVLKPVKNEQDFTKAKTRIKQIVQDCYTGLKGRKFSLDQLTFRVMLSRSISGYTKTTPQHVKAAKQLAEKGRDVKPGDIISYVKVQGPLGVKPVQLARIDEVDVDKYVGHIESTFGQVLEALGIEFDDIIGIKKLDFFSR